VGIGQEVLVTSLTFKCSVKSVLAFSYMKLMTALQTVKIINFYCYSSLLHVL